MALKVKKSESSAVVDPGEYLAVITKVEEGYHDVYKENYTWTIKIKDATLDGEPIDNGGELVELSFFSGRKWTGNEKNKLNQLLQALGYDKEIGAELDLEECIGKKLRVIIIDKNTEKGRFSRVNGFLPLKKTAKKTEEEREEKQEEKKEKEEKPEKEKKEEKKEEKSSSADDGLFNFDSDD